MIWNYLNLKNKGRENKANRASLPYRDAVHPGNRSEDVRHNEECRFFLHNNNLQSRGKPTKFQNHYLTLAKRLKFTTPDNQILQKCARRARKMAQWVKVLTTKPDRTHMRKRRNKSHKWSSDLCMLATKAYTINILKFLSFYLYSVHICIYCICTSAYQGQRKEEGNECSRAGTMGVCELPYEFKEPILGPLEKQQVFSATEPPSSPKKHFKTWTEKSNEYHQSQKYKQLN